MNYTEKGKEMANYDRRILVPYLQDICSVEMLCRKLEQDIKYYKSEADKYAQWANLPYSDPKRPEAYEYLSDNGNSLGTMGAGAIFCIGGLFLWNFPFLGPILTIAGLLLGLFIFSTGFSEYRQHERYNEKRYEEALEKYKKQVAQNKKNRDLQPEWRRQSQKWRDLENNSKNRLQDAKTLRNNVYSVNIIPSRYRTIHAVYYLYDFFSSCRETDLEKTIQTMLLDEIVQRMDKLIVQNQEILLNQRRQLALQESQNQILAANHQEEMIHIARLERNQELQLDYQRMIERNQEVTNFFLAADYIKKNR